MNEKIKFYLVEIFRQIIYFIFPNPALKPWFRSFAEYRQTKYKFNLLRSLKMEFESILYYHKKYI